MIEYELEDLRERLRVRASLAGRRDNQHHYDDNHNDDKKHHHDDDNDDTENRENGMDAPQPAAPVSEPTPATTTTKTTTTTTTTTTRDRFMELNDLPQDRMDSAPPRGVPPNDLEAASHRMIGKNDDQQQHNSNDDNNTSGSQPPRIPRVRFASSSVSLPRASPPPETAPTPGPTDVDHTNKRSNNNKSYDNTTFNSVTWHQASQKVWAVGAGSLVLLTILIVFLFRTNGHDC